MKKSCFQSGLVLIATAVILLSDVTAAFSKPRLRPNLSPRNPIPRTNIIRTRIRGLTNHGRDQIHNRNGGRGVSSAAILDAVRNGQVTRTRDKKGRPQITYQGKNAVVNVNRDGRLITAWPKNKNGQRR
ncbi:hypothetical protein QT971_19105 [Microcoleus sp. herbarium19]|uniref:hypothetical protein n=1 Tax=Microcoleus sp. herbarium13 TaxID=3055438 RepID=UPI002FD5E16E